MRPHPAGAVVAVDVRTGRLLALYSKPGFDPERPVGRRGARSHARGLQPPLRRPAPADARQDDERRVPAGIDLQALQRARRPRRQDARPGPHREVRRAPGHRSPHLPVHPRARRREPASRPSPESCNVYFFHLAETVGMDRIARVAQAFGLGQKTGLGVNPEAPGRDPDPVLVRAPLPRSVPARLHAQHGHRRGRRDRHAPAARARLRGARQRRHAVPAPGGARRRDERRRGRAGVPAARPQADRSCRRTTCAA